MNLNAIATAKQTYLLEAALSSFGGFKHKETKIDKYLPFAMDNESTKAVSQLTADCFWDLMNEDLPEYVWQAFNEPALIEILKALKPESS